MSSSVFYKFKNSKEPERIVFDGTGISVFELKREIITASGLGDGTDFDLHLYPEDQPTTEYDDDTTIISRSSTVIAARRPAPRGQGRAARYVSGRAPVRAIKKADAKPTVATASGPVTEQDAEAAFLAESAEVWNAQKESFAHAKPIFHKKKNVNVPDHPPPAGYICYRCQKKGHWIQACPTNDDPDFKPMARAKRTTGIPRSFLKTVEKPVDEEDARGVMLNADGEYVQVMTDNKTWEKFQEKASATKAQAANEDAANKEVRELGFECPIDNRMFVDPVKTPCCGKTYCHDCIENALADRDLVCPNCSTEGVLIDDLAADDEMVQKMKAYEAEKAKEKLEKEQQAQEEAKAAATPSNNEENSVPPADEKATAVENNPVGSESPKPVNSSASQLTVNVKSPLTVAAYSTASPTSGAGAGGNGSDTDTSTTSKKRKQPPTDIMPPTAPKAMRQQKEQQSRQGQDQSSVVDQMVRDLEAMKKQPLPGAPKGPIPSSMNMPINPMMGMPPVMNGMNPMAHMNGQNSFPQQMNNGWNGGFQQGFPNQMGYNQGWNNGFQPNMGYGNMPNAMSGMNGYGGGNWNPNQNQGFNNNMGWQGQGGPHMGQPAGGFPNQQRTVFSEQPNQQDAYERKPLNPHRSQNKHRKHRPQDFHYV